MVWCLEQGRETSVHGGSVTVPASSICGGWSQEAERLGGGTISRRFILRQTVVL